MCSGSLYSSNAGAGELMDERFDVRLGVGRWRARTSRTAVTARFYIMAAHRQLKQLFRFCVVVADLQYSFTPWKWLRTRWAWQTLWSSGCFNCFGDISNSSNPKKRQISTSHSSWIDIGEFLLIGRSYRLWSGFLAAAWPPVLADAPVEPALSLLLVEDRWMLPDDDAPLI